MSNEGEEWADGAEGFFTEFASSVSQEKSQRRKNVEARAADTLLQQQRTEQREVDRAESAAEARRRIAAAVLSRASAKEIEAAARNARKLQKMNEKNKASFGASAAAAGSSAGVPGISSSSTLFSNESGGDASPVKQQVEGGSANKTFRKKCGKVDAKFSRKAARREVAKENQIKYRRVLRKQR